MTLSADNNLTRSLRLATGLIGGYFVTSGSIAILGSALPLTGMATSEALTLALLLGFCLFPALVIWAAATRRLITFSAAILVLAVVLNVAAPMLVGG